MTLAEALGVLLVTVLSLGVAVGAGAWLFMAIVTRIERRMRR